MAKKQEPASVYTFKVALAGAKKIWRRISILSTQTLDDLHEAIFQAFDRFDEHLYSFYIAPLGLRGRAADDAAVEYSHSQADGGQPSDRARIGALGLAVGQQFGYLFDFGDNWEHVITVEQTGGQPDGKPYPRIVEKNGDSPPQYPDDEDDSEEDESQDGDEEQ